MTVIYQDHTKLVSYEHTIQQLLSLKTGEPKGLRVFQDLNQPANSLTSSQDHPWLQSAIKSLSEQSSIPLQDLTVIKNSYRSFEILFFSKVLRRFAHNFRSVNRCFTMNLNVISVL